VVAELLMCSLPRFGPARKRASSESEPIAALGGVRRGGQPADFLGAEKTAEFLWGKKVAGFVSAEGSIGVGENPVAGEKANAGALRDVEEVIFLDRNIAGPGLGNAKACSFLRGSLSSFRSDNLFAWARSNSSNAAHCSSRNFDRAKVIPGLPSASTMRARPAGRYLFLRQLGIC
jgi:hypothetical protein